MENSSSPPQDHPVKQIQMESRQLLKSLPPRFYHLFFLFTVPPSLATILYLTFLFSPLFETYYSMDNHVVIPSLITTISLTISCFLFNLVCSSCALGSITYSVFHSFHGRQLDLKSLFASLVTSFLPIMSATLSVQFITITIISLISFLIFALFVMLAGFCNLDLVDDLLPFMPMIMVLMSIGATYIVARVHAGWSLATVIVALEPGKWGFESLKLSKSLINDNKNENEISSTIGFKISFGYWLAQGMLAILAIMCLIFTGTSLMREDKYLGVLNGGMLNGGVVLMNSIYMAWFRIRYIAAVTVFYVHRKASFVDHGGEYHNDCHDLMSSRKYVKLAGDENVSSFV